jgi:L-ribulose-5-phosphate 4-epimerase
MLKQLKEEVFQANIDLLRNRLVILTWGNVSGISRADGYIVIKPSGVGYELMKPADMVVVDFDGKIVEGKLRPSSDLPTHLQLYKNFSFIGGIAHAHSMYATIFAQACKEIPCFGTTHADHFNGPIPITRFLNKKEVESRYEENTGSVIVERFKSLDPETMPAVLVGGHAPFTWGTSADDAMKNILILEHIAKLAMGSIQLNPDLHSIPYHIQEKHFNRKHGPDSYYGQKNK